MGAEGVEQAAGRSAIHDIRRILIRSIAFVSHDDAQGSSRISGAIQRTIERFADCHPNASGRAGTLWRELDNREIAWKLFLSLSTVLAASATYLPKPTS